MRLLAGLLTFALIAAVVVVAVQTIRVAHLQSQVEIQRAQIEELKAYRDARRDADNAVDGLPDGDDALREWLRKMGGAE